MLENKDSPSPKKDELSPPKVNSKPEPNLLHTSLNSRKGPAEVKNQIVEIPSFIEESLLEDKDDPVLNKIREYRAIHNAAGYATVTEPSAELVPVPSKKQSNVKDTNNLNRNARQYKSHPKSRSNSRVGHEYLEMTPFEKSLRMNVSHFDLINQSKKDIKKEAQQVQTYDNRKSELATHGRRIYLPSQKINSSHFRFLNEKSNPALIQRDSTPNNKRNLEPLDDPLLPTYKQIMKKKRSAVASNNGLHPLLQIELRNKLDSKQIKQIYTRRLVQSKQKKGTVSDYSIFTLGDLQKKSSPMHEDVSK